MKNLYLLFAAITLAVTSFSQLTVTTNPTTATANVCAGNSISITATAVPVAYTVSTIPTSLIPDAGINILADAGIAVTPRSSGINMNDCRWDNISLPFNFRYFGNVYNSVNISSNGWVGLGNTNATTTGFGFALPRAGAPDDAIHGITADLDLSTATGGTLEYFEVGTAPNRSFVISYNAVKFLATKGGGTATFQIILKETSNQVEIHTQSCTNTSATNPKAQGVENATGTIASTVTGRNNTADWTATGYANSYRFTPDNITYSWSPATGLNTTAGATVIATPAATTTYTVSALNTGNSQTGNTTVTVTVNPASYTLAATAGGAQICQNITVSSLGTNFRDGNCNIIASVTPAGASPVTNSINTCIKLDTGATKKGTSTLYVARRYDIEPIISPATSTANITLYYLQSEFNNYNLKAADSGRKLLPTGPADATGISNLLLRQFHGTGTAPNNYTGASQDFTTATSGFTVVWNTTRSWWEITVPVTGFSGFYVTSALSGVLPITLEYFKGVQADNKDLLSWKVNCTSAHVIFEIQRSADGVHFIPLSYLSADQLRCSQPFDIADEKPLSGINYYRIKITDADGKFYYSNIISFLLKTKDFQIISVSPNPVAQENAVLKINAGEKAQINISISDFSGRVISIQTAQLLPGINKITLKTYNLAGGAYNITTYAPGASPKAIKLLKQ